MLAHTLTFEVWNYDSDLPDFFPEFATAASELATDTKSANISHNSGAAIAACMTQSTIMVAFWAV